MIFFAVFITTRTFFRLTFAIEIKIARAMTKRYVSRSLQWVSILLIAAAILAAFINACFRWWR